MRDRMTIKERLDGLVKGIPIDRVPCMPMVFSHAAVVCGQPLAKTYDDAELSFKCHEYCQELYGYDDGPVFYSHTVFGTAEFGGTIEFPYKKYTAAPTVTTYPVNTAEDVYKLEVPDDITTTGTMPICLEFSRLQKATGRTVTVPVGSPLTWAGSVIGVDTLMKNMISNPSLVHHLLRKVTDFCLKIIEHWVKEFGPERMMLFHEAPNESNQLISPNFFREYAVPYLKETHNRAQELGVGLFYNHICGEQNKNLPAWQEILQGKRGFLSFGQEVSLHDASKCFPEHIIAGNVDPSMIQEGSPEQVYAECCKTVEEGKNHPGGYVLAPGCDLAPMAPPVNVYMMMKAVRDKGQY